MFKQSIEIQQRAIKHYQPDIIVGSSWGGAVSIGEYNLISSLFNLVIGGVNCYFLFQVAVACLKREIWTGPTILLAPAVNELSSSFESGLTKLPSSITSPIRLLHGDEDTTIPLANSRKFVEINTHVKLFVIPGEDHGLLKATRDCLPQHVEEILSEH